MTAPGFNPYVPRPIDVATQVPLDADADLSGLDEAKVFAAPHDPAAWPRWRDQLTRWRLEARQRLHYTGATYDALDATAQRRDQGDCFSVCLIWLWDETLYDHARGVFTVDTFLDAAEHAFGGHDGVVLWHAYPVIGVDDRNQFDFYRDIPELPDVVRAFQRRGVRVFVDHNPWDVGTRREPGTAVLPDGRFADRAMTGAPQRIVALAARYPAT